VTQDVKPIVVKVKGESVYSAGSRKEGKGIPRDYRDGAMIYETSTRIEKARLNQLDSSTFQSTKFRVESATIAQGNIDDMQNELIETSPGKFNVDESSISQQNAELSNGSEQLEFEL
jgi:hypothetical protein